MCISNLVHLHASYVGLRTNVHTKINISFKIKSLMFYILKSMGYKMIK